MNQIYIYLDNRTLPKKVPSLFTHFFFQKLKKKRSVGCCFDSKNEERGKEGKKKKRKTKREGLTVFRHEKLICISEEEEKREKYFYLFFPFPVHSHICGVCVREDFPSRRYCNMCAPSFVLYFVTISRFRWE